MIVIIASAVILSMSDSIKPNKKNNAIPNTIAAGGKIHLLSFILSSFRSKRGVMSSYNLIISYFFRCVKFFLIHGFVDKAYRI